MALKPSAKMNVSVNYNEGLYYVDYKDLYMYHEIKNPTNIIPESKLPAGHEAEYEFDQDMTQVKYDAFRQKLTDHMVQHFPSMKAADQDTFADRAKKKRIIVGNQLFNVILEDNTWSIAVELKLAPKGNKGLQTQMFPSFLAGLRVGLFNQFETLYVRDGSWSAIPIDKTAPANIGNTYINPEVGYATPEMQKEIQATQPAYAYAEN